jgi:pimeloyl-ACP methyl ester carboxylesterase
MRRVLVLGWAVALGSPLVGCVAPPASQAGRVFTFYVPGAGLDLGDRTTRAGLERAGYAGVLLTAGWSYTLNPAIDQTLRFFARHGSRRLASEIKAVLDAHPDAEINIIAMSAGTAVAAWALEGLEQGYCVNNVVFMASSLDYRYDVSAAMRHVKGRLYNYYSAADLILIALMRPFGTIDGHFIVPAAGEIGLQIPRNCPERVVNVHWRREFTRYGYFGGHFSVTSPGFVAAVIARHVTPDARAEPLQTEPARPAARYSRAGSAD